MKKNEQLPTLYGLPADVKWCTRCVMSNQRPASTAEFRHTINSKKVTLHMDAEGVCDACRQGEIKNSIDWKAREEELLRLLDRYRKNDGSAEPRHPWRRRPITPSMAGSTRLPRSR